MVTTIDEKIILCDNSFFGFELKYTDAPKITKSMMIALNDLQLDHLIVGISRKDRFSFVGKYFCVWA
jgi:uncharacterized protein